MSNEGNETTDGKALAILRWMARDDRGVSSEVLALASLGLRSVRWGVMGPGDIGDSGRCERLARECPFVVDALPALVEANPREWGKWADRIRSAVNAKS